MRRSTRPRHFSRPILETLEARWCPATAVYNALYQSLNITSDSDDQITETAYDYEGRVTSTTQYGPSGADIVTSYTYDTAGRQLTSTTVPGVLLREMAFTL